jgi:hypothetical protein
MENENENHLELASSSSFELPPTTTTAAAAALEEIKEDMQPLKKYHANKKQ